MNYYWIYADKTSGDIRPQHSNHSPYDSTGAFDTSLVPQNSEVLGPYTNALGSMPSDFQTAYETPDAYLYQNGKFVNNVNYSSLQISALKQAKLLQLQTSFGQSLYQGFQSSADGTQRTYAIDPVAMSKWSAMLSVINAGKGPTSVTIKDFSGNQVNLTIAQFQNMAADGFNFFNNQELHLWNLETQVNDATTVDEVNKVTW